MTWLLRSACMYFVEKASKFSTVRLQKNGKKIDPDWSNQVVYTPWNLLRSYKRLIKSYEASVLNMSFCVCHGLIVRFSGQLVENITNVLKDKLLWNRIWWMEVLEGFARREPFKSVKWESSFKMSETLFAKHNVILNLILTFSAFYEWQFNLSHLKNATKHLLK